MTFLRTTRWLWIWGGVAFILAAVRGTVLRDQSAAVTAAYESVQIVTTLALGLALLWLPGVAASGRATSPELRAAILIGAGPLLLAAWGVIAWGLGPWIAPVVTGELGAGGIWAGLGWLLWRRPGYWAPSWGTQRILAIAALCALAAIAKAAYSGGPEGELFRGEVRRTLAVGNRGDCETSYNVVEVATRHLSPFSADAFAYFAPWSFFSRGPLAGLAASPLIFATGKPSQGRTSTPWQPFDPWGHASYRVAMAILATTSFVALFLVLGEFVAEQTALMAASAMALCPFVLHEVMFTWPKLAATTWLLISFLLAHRGRAALAGAAIAVGYLFHPLALLWTPWIGLWLIGRGLRSPRALVLRGTRFALPLVAVVVPWMTASDWARKLSGSVHAAQSLFFRYFVWAEGWPATPATWLHSRWMNFSNTFLPFWLHFFGEKDPDLNSVFGPSSPVVKFAFSWWNTLPLGLGLVCWALCLAAVVQAWRTFSAAIALLLVGPALLLCVYWGDKSTGLMRECGHPLVPACLGLAALWFDRSPTGAARVFCSRVFPWLQLPGAWLMFWLTTWANPHPPESPLQAFNPVWILLNGAALAAIAGLAACARVHRASNGTT